MKNFLFNITIILLIITPSLFSWGEEGHKLINKKAVELLPPEMSAILDWKEYIIENAADADKRRRFDSTEAPKHYIDVDFYPEFLNGNMTFDKDELISRYGKEKVYEMGILPWTTLETYNNLVLALKNKNRDKAMIMIADLGHYIADGHQPMHTVLNYDGQLSDQKGVHARYESRMVNRYLGELENEFTLSTPIFIDNILESVFSYISTANFYNDVLLASDLIASKSAGSTDNDDYYRILWFRTKHLTKIKFEYAINTLASFIYTAWIEAGKPDFNKIN